MRLILINKMPIFEQLKLEEALLRATNENWCLLNYGATPAVVMGISGKAEKLLDLQKVAQEKIPVIRRFSGGGTVYIDHQTVFATLICNEAKLTIPLQPQAILQWSESFYKPLFPGFSLRENDYVFGEKKFGGNAQYLQKNRWLLHTSFLWDFCSEKMQCLTLPEKRPTYRQNRSHSDFLCTLRPLYPTQEKLVEALSTHAQKTFGAILTPLTDVLPLMQLPHRQSTTLL